MQISKKPWTGSPYFYGLSVLYFQISVFAAIYVSPTGNDASGNGTVLQPYYSLSKAVAIVNAGDTILMRGGTYQYTATVIIDKKGTSAAGFKVLPYQDEKPVLDYSGWKPAAESIRFYARGITLTGSFWYFKGIEICHAPDNGVKLEGSHNTFELCVFHHNGDGGLQIGLNKEDYKSNPDPENLAAYNSIINCDSYRNADSATSYENADGFACKLYAGKGNYFYGCRSWENCDDGWDCYQTDYLITIENCWTWHNGDPAMWGLTSFNGDGNGFKLGGNGEPCPIVVKKCVAFDIHFGAMSAFSENDNAMPITLYNCIAWNCARDFNMQNQAHIIKNCVAFENTRQAPKDISSTAVQQNDSWNIPGVTASADDFVSLDVALALAPRQADGSLPDNGFAKLKQGSDLIDKGVDVGLPFTGIAPDLGAYEFGDVTKIVSQNVNPLMSLQHIENRHSAGIFDVLGRNVAPSNAVSSRHPMAIMIMQTTSGDYKSRLTNNNMNLK